MEAKLVDFLNHFEMHKRDETTLRSVYIYGGAGCGKTTFAMNVLKRENYDCITYSASDLRNKSIIESFNIYNMSSNGVLSSFLNGGRRRKIAILMDEIECMNTGDKGGINALIKMVRPKRTKKQKDEDTTSVPIICIGNLSVDKKVTELMKCSLVLQIPPPSDEFMLSILAERLPDQRHVYGAVMDYAERDLNKLTSMCSVIDEFGVDAVRHFEKKRVAVDTKDVVKRLLQAPAHLADHAGVNEPDRTIVAMLWHENAADMISPSDYGTVYEPVMENICFADFVDRITFQKQIWQFNEMSSMVKTFYTNTMLKRSKRAPAEIRFTKILTKYSTEYNNATFLQRLTQDTGLDKKDLFAFVAAMKHTLTADEISKRLNSELVSAVDVNRLFRFLDKLQGDSVLDE